MYSVHYIVFIDSMHSILYPYSNASIKQYAVQTLCLRTSTVRAVRYAMVYFSTVYECC
jgi:hypothetical protein